jgi:hypothetical protein
MTTPGALVAGRIERAPTNGRVDVVIHGFDTDQRFNDCHFTPRMAVTVTPGAQAPSVSSLGAAYSTTSTTSQALTLTAGAAIGKHVIVFGWVNAASKSPLTITDSKGNAWQLDDEDEGTSGGWTIWSSRITTALVAGDTITLQYGEGPAPGTVQSVANKGLAATVVTGLAPTGWNDASAFANSSGTLIDAGTVPTGSSGDVLFGAALQNANSDYTPAGGWTEIHDTSSATGGTATTAWQVGGATSPAPGFQTTSTISAAWRAVTVAYRTDMTASTTNVVTVDPAVGDLCLVAFDDHGEGWVVAWEPS